MMVTAMMLTLIVIKKEVTIDNIDFEVDDGVKG